MAIRELTARKIPRNLAYRTSTKVRKPRGRLIRWVCAWVQMLGDVQQDKGEVVPRGGGKGVEEHSAYPIC